MSSFDYDAFVKDKAYADTYTKSVQRSVLDFANHTNGAVTAYLRYNPEVPRILLRTDMKSCRSVTGLWMLLRSLWHSSIWIRVKEKE